MCAAQNDIPAQSFCFQGVAKRQHTETALISLLTNTPVENKVSMTGEITLRGTITAIGGVKEKSIGALCAGVTDVILPEENRKDAEEIPDEVKRKITFHFVSSAEDAWKIAVPALKRKKVSAKTKKSS